MRAAWLLSALALGCSVDRGGLLAATDAGTRDAGRHEVVPDAGPSDAGAGDGGAIDAGPPDAGPPDAGPPDTGPPDTGPPDVGPPDVGPPDVGPPDVGPPADCAALYGSAPGYDLCPAETTSTTCEIYVALGGLSCNDICGVSRCLRSYADGDPHCVHIGEHLCETAQGDGICVCTR